MPTKLVITANTVDDNGNIISSHEISKKEIKPPIEANDFGYNQNEQLKIIHNIQQNLLDQQADFLKSGT